MVVRAAASKYGKTVIAIAHRLKTILGYDLVAVMSHGSLVEMGQPMERWAAKEGFRKLCDAAEVVKEDFAATVL